jgi:hypothetical protein
MNKKFNQLLQIPLVISVGILMIACGTGPRTTVITELESQVLSEIKPSDIFTYGIVSGDVLTLNGNFELGSVGNSAASSSMHANKGYTLNGNIKLGSGTISAATSSSLPAGTQIICVDNARLNACKNGKPSVSIPMVAVPKPDIAALKADYLPQSYTSTLQGNQTFTSSGDASAKLPVGTTVLVKGNLTING